MWYLIVEYLVYGFCWAMYTKYQLLDEKNKPGNVRGKWHFWGGAMRFIALTVIPMTCIYVPGLTWKELLPGVVLSLPWFDIAINIWALKTSLFYNGSTSKWDIKLRGSKWVIYATLIIFSVLIKLNVFKTKQKTEL